MWVDLEKWLTLLGPEFSTESLGGPQVFFYVKTFSSTHNSTKRKKIFERFQLFFKLISPLQIAAKISSTKIRNMADTRFLEIFKAVSMQFPHRA